MQIRHATHPDDLAGLGLADLRKRFVADDLFAPGEVRLVYTHHDRMVLGGVVPLAGQPLTLPTPDDLRAEYFCERRELAVVAVGGTGVVVVDGERYTLNNKDVLYIGRGTREVSFEAGDAVTAFYLASALSHVEFPTTLVPLAEADATAAGDQSTANRRTIYKHLHQDGPVRTAQLVLGITALEPGSVWNSMPPHLHDRRTEVYLYMDLPAEHRIQHFMGQPSDPKVLSLKNLDTVISPSWSVHFGAGTTNYSFVWVMAGENQPFTDMDQVAVTELG